MLALLELDVEEAVGCLLLLVDLGHHAVAGEDFAPVDEERDGRLLAQLHSFADDRVKLDRLEVVRDQEPIYQARKKGEKE